MADKRIKFSILVPVYNVEKYLDACVQSVLKQTYDNYELILVNDGSKDASGEICDRYAQLYENIFAYHKENAGQLHTREYAIEKASGDYYVFLDSDDTLRENALEIIYDKSTQYGCDCLIYQWERVCKGKVVSFAPKFPDICIEDKRELYKKCFLTEEYNSMCRKAIKADLFKEKQDYSNDYSVRFGEDLIQSLNVLKNSNKVVFIDAVLYNYTINPDSVSMSATYSNPDQVNLSSLQNVLAFLERESVWEEEEFVQLKNFYNYLVCGKLLAICKQDMPSKKKLEMFQHIRSTKHYQEFLSQTHYSKGELGKRTLIFSLFQKKYDKILILYLWIYWRIQRIKKRTKK